MASDPFDIGQTLADPVVMAHWDYGMIDDPEMIDQFIAAHIEVMERQEGFYWSMRRIGEVIIIGCCDVVEIGWRHRRAEIGFVLRQRYWGRGYARQGVKLWSTTWPDRGSSN